MRPSRSRQGRCLILPPTITVFSNTPASLTVTGGVPPYFVVSSNPAILPVGSSSSTGTILLIPANVPAATAVLITVTDTASTQAQATATVQPAPIFNTLTITPASAACGANTSARARPRPRHVQVTGPGGAGIPGRQVRFDVVTGAFAIQSSDPANPLVSTLTVVTDQFGNAHVVLQANVEAPTQPAFLRATDLTTGEQQTAQFTIVQTINGSTVLSVVPSTVNITGPDSATCSAVASAPISTSTAARRRTRWQATFPNLLTCSSTTVAAPGLPFSAITNGGCVDPLVFTIRDATGLQTTATLNNVVGSTPPVTPVTPVNVAPKSQTVSSCGGKTISVLVSGGTPPYGVSSATPGVIVSPPSLSAPGYFFISGMTSPVAPPNTVYDFLLTDSSAPQQTFGFSITCSTVGSARLKHGNGAAARRRCHF